ncbi:MAG: HigA family addiction module antidote protein [Rhodocyclaceae bacterium]|nr:HigA family addiction module antidote protein [Rhodocyclaceae bacterium]
MSKQLHPVSPGEMLAEEFLQPLRMSNYRLAKEIGVPAQRIGEILAGRRAITADTDLRLCRFFGLSDGWWLRLQADYDTAIAKAALSRNARENPTVEGAGGVWQFALIFRAGCVSGLLLGKFDKTGCVPVFAAGGAHFGRRKELPPKRFGRGMLPRPKRLLRLGKTGWFARRVSVSLRNGCETPSRRENLLMASSQGHARVPSERTSKEDR